MEQDTGDLSREAPKDLVQVKAEIPRDVKRRFFAALALRGISFSAWLRLRMYQWLAANEEGKE